MPTYEYECGKCRRRFERFQRITEKPVGRCPVCGSKVKRLPGAGGGILFKGTGFYQTDYRSASYRAAAKKEKESGSGGTKPAGDGKAAVESKTKKEAKGCSLE
jgi:putative FmdB family regulatory protein